MLARDLPGRHTLRVHKRSETRVSGYYPILVYLLIREDPADLIEQVFDIIRGGIDLVTGTIEIRIGRAYQCVVTPRNGEEYPFVLARRKEHRPRDRQFPVDEMYPFCGQGYRGRMRLIRPYEPVRPSACGVDYTLRADGKFFSFKDVFSFRSNHSPLTLYEAFGFDLIRDTTACLIGGDRVIEAEPDIVHLGVTIKHTAL